MKQFVYKVIITLIAIILVYEFTIGKLINRYTDKFNNISIYGCGSRSSVFANIMELNINFFII